MERERVRDEEYRVQKWWEEKREEGRERERAKRRDKRKQRSVAGAGELYHKRQIFVHQLKHLEVAHLVEHLFVKVKHTHHRR